MHPETNAHIYTNAWVPLSGQHRSEAIWAIASMYGSTEGLDGILDALASGRVRPMLLCGILQNVSEGAASSRGGVPGDTGNARYSYNPHVDSFPNSIVSSSFYTRQGTSRSPGTCRQNTSTCIVVNIPGIAAQASRMLFYALWNDISIACILSQGCFLMHSAVPHCPSPCTSVWPSLLTCLTGATSFLCLTHIDVH